jgi:hypothetical protein
MGQHKGDVSVSFKRALLWLLGGATAITASAFVFMKWIPMAFYMRGAAQLFALGVIMILASIGMFFGLKKRKH